MDQKKSLWAIMGIIILTLVVVLSPWQTAWSQECRIIRIHGMSIHDSVRVEPETLVISKGTCVIWLNRAAASEMKVIFEEGKKCAEVTEGATGFSLDHQNCFVTTWIPFAGTTSLRFMEAGTYEYIIEEAIPGDPDKKGRKIAIGKIVISDDE